MSTPDPVLRRAAAEPPAHASLVQQLVVSFLLPLFFIVLFPLAFVSAFHAPGPHEVRLLVVVPDQVAGQVAEALDATDAFSVSSPDAAEARDEVGARTVDGAILVSVAPGAGPVVALGLATTTYLADAGGLDQRPSSGPPVPRSQ